MILQRNNIKNKFSCSSSSSINPEIEWLKLYDSSLIPERKIFYETLLYRSYLIGWYWNDRGIGPIIHNMALEGISGGGLLPHLNIIEGENLFWEEWGIDNQFGCLKTDGTDLITIQKEIDRNLNVCIGMFFKPNNFINLGFSSILFYFENIELNPTGFFLAQNESELYNHESVEIDKSQIRQNGILNWFFIFQEKNGITKLALSDGTILNLIGETFTYPLIRFINIIMMGNNIEESSYNSISIGDILIFNNKVLTQENWGKWYDSLRSRYGMVERL